MSADMDFLAELFEPVGRVTFRRMFGGISAYRDGRIFAIILDDIVYLKVDDTNRPAFEAEGSTPFTYAHKDGRITTMSYWRIPDRLLDDPEELRDWSLAAIEASIRASVAKPKKTRSRKPSSGT